MYELSIRDVGEFSPFAISEGGGYAFKLHLVNAVKAERVASRHKTNFRA